MKRLALPTSIVALLYPTSVGCVLDVAYLDGVAEELCETSCDCLSNGSSWMPSEVGDLNPSGMQANAVLSTGLRLELRDTGEPGQLEARVCKFQDSPPMNFLYSIHVTFKDRLGAINFDEVMSANGTTCTDYIALDNEAVYGQGEELKVSAWRVVSPYTSTAEWDPYCTPDSKSAGGTCWYDDDGPSLTRICAQ